jgi:hypothetical protein
MRQKAVLTRRGIGIAAVYTGSFLSIGNKDEKEGVSESKKRYYFWRKGWS